MADPYVSFIGSFDTLDMAAVARVLVDWAGPDAGIEAPADDIDEFDFETEFAAVYMYPPLRSDKALLVGGELPPDLESAQVELGRLVELFRAASIGGTIDYSKVDASGSQVGTELTLEIELSPDP